MASISPKTTGPKLPSHSLTIHNTVKTLLPFRFEVLHAASAPGEMSCLLHASQESRKGWQTALFESQAKLMSVTLSPEVPVQCWPQLGCKTEMPLLVPIIFIENTRGQTGTTSSASLRSSLFSLTNFLLITSTDQNLLVNLYHPLLPPQL